MQSLCQFLYLLQTDMTVLSQATIRCRSISVMSGHCKFFKTIFSEKQDRTSWKLSKPTISDEQIRAALFSPHSLMSITISSYIFHPRDVPMAIHASWLIFFRARRRLFLDQRSDLSQQPQQRGTLQFPIHSSHSFVSNPIFQELESWLSKNTPFQRTRLPLMHHHHTIP